LSFNEADSILWRDLEKNSCFHAEKRRTRNVKTKKMRENQKLEKQISTAGSKGRKKQRSKDLPASMAEGT
jgi:hypothetical protein